MIEMQEVETLEQSEARWRLEAEEIDKFKRKHAEIIKKCNYKSVGDIQPFLQLKLRIISALHKKSEFDDSPEHAVIDGETYLSERYVNKLMIFALEYGRKENEKAQIKIREELIAQAHDALDEILATF
jgi:hypothetical protein